eukprot:GFUD01042431.1.p1 GENE.GFUD01042431.1~~GFUD01042431.1.p1  ORF type:complete len:237 (-),score=52.65 GFUD01042431.1:128-838(-)
MIPKLYDHLMDSTNNNVRTIYLSRHGESNNNLYGKIGGDAGLSQQGWLYAKALFNFFQSRHISGIWTSQLKRTHQTTKYLACPKIIVETGINEISAGDHDSMTYEEIAQQFPEEFALRDQDKLRYRYPNGESYMDVVARLEPVMKKIMHENNLLIVSHQATLRCVLTLLLGTEMEELPYMRVPLHTVIELRLCGEEVEVTNHRLKVECVDTHRAKPGNCEINRNPSDACITVPVHL